MHILFVWRPFSQSNIANGITTYVNNIAEGLAALDCQVTILCEHHDNTNRTIQGQKRQLEIRELPCWHLKLARHALSRIHLKGLSQWIRLLGSEIPLKLWLSRFSSLLNIDIAVFFDSSMPEGWLYSMNPRIPTTLSLHGGSITRIRAYEGGSRSQESTWSEKRNHEMAIRTPFLYCPSEALARATELEFGLPERSIAVISNPLDSSFCKPEGRMTRNSGSEDVLYVGRFSPEKGLGTLIDAIPRIAALSDNVRFIFVGAGSRNADSDNYRTIIRTLFNDLNIADRYRLLWGLSRVQLADYYRQAAVCVVPSLWETCSNVILEAMGWEIPVVATRAGGTPEIIDHGRTGWLVEPGNSGQLADAILRVLKDTLESRQVAENARREVLSRNSLEAIAKQTLDFYTHCIENWHGRAKILAARRGYEQSN